MGLARALGAPVNSAGKAVHSKQDGLVCWGCGCGADAGSRGRRPAHRDIYLGCQDHEWLEYFCNGKEYGSVTHPMPSFRLTL